MNPAEVQDIVAQLQVALNSSEDAPPPEGILAFRLLAGMALNLAHLAHPNGEPA